MPTSYQRSEVQETQLLPFRVSHPNSEIDLLTFRVKQTLKFKKIHVLQLVNNLAFEFLVLRITNKSDILSKGHNLLVISR